MHIKFYSFQDKSGSGAVEVYKGGIDKREFGVKVSAKNTRSIQYAVLVYGRQIP